jgi:hypothetical protein
MRRKRAVFISFLMIIVLILAGCRFSKPTTPSESSPTVGQTPSPVFNSPVETTSPVIVTSIPASTSPTNTTPSPLTTGPTPTSSEIQTIVIDKPVPTSYITYTDPNGLFKISYPGDWEIPNDKTQEIADASSQVSQFLKTSLKSKFEGGLLFQAQTNRPLALIILWFLPNVSNPTPGYEAVYNGVNARLYKTIISGFDAIMVEQEGSSSDFGLLRSLDINIVVNRNTWCLYCSARPEDYHKWADDFKFIAGSLRILK